MCLKPDFTAGGENPSLPPCRVNAAKGILPTRDSFDTFSGTKCALQVDSGAVSALEYPL